MRKGSADKYPWRGFYTSTAQAEGAIDGVAADYEVRSAHATEFAFSMKEKTCSEGITHCFASRDWLTGMTFEELVIRPSAMSLS